MTDVVMQLNDVTVHRNRRDILRGVSLEVRRDEVLALVGPNGAGKSTLLGVLAGEVKPATGTALTQGRPTASYRPKELSRLRAVLLQSNEVSFPFDVQQVVQMGRNPWAGTDQEDRDDEAIAEALASVDVSALLHRRFNELSGGERARVSLARVIAQDTETLLLDEPTAALDLHHQDRVMRLIRARAGAGRAVVVVVHDLSLAAAYADRVALLVGGEIIADGPPREVITADRLSEVYGVTIRVVDSPDGHPMVVPVRGVA